MSAVANNVAPYDVLQPEYGVAYGLELGAIGVRLDAEHRCQVRVIESDDGFIVSSSGGGDASPVDCFFTHSELGKSAKARQRFRPSFRRRVPGWYEGVLGQIGGAVEGMVGYSILIDQHDQGYFASYQYYSPESGFMLHKHRMILDANGLPRRLTSRESNLRVEPPGTLGRAH